MIRVNDEYVVPALESTLPWLHLLPSVTQRKIKLALSVIYSEGASPDELREELGGSNWVIARRTQRVVERYGKDVICLTPKQYDAAERRCIEKRFPDNEPPEVTR